jgi:trimeric autotransporter adhesin
MSKKKAAKLGLTAAVAASAFVAGNPADAAAATKADQLVTNAVNAANQLKPFYGSTSLEVSAEFTAKFNAAKAAITKAKAVKLNDYQSYQIQKAEETVTKAARYIDAVNVVNKQLEPAKEELQTYIDDQEINDDVKAAYDNLSAAIKKAESAIGKVYGSSVRAAFLSEFVVPAKIAKETVIYEVSRYNLLKEIDADVEAGNLKVAEEKFAKLERLEKRAKEIKEEGNKLHPGKYPELPKIEEALAKQKEDVVKKYEEKLAPAVVSVSAINAKQIEVKFNKAVDVTTAQTVANYDFSEIVGSSIGANPTAAKVQDDGKTVVLTLGTPISTETTFTLTVSGVKVKGSDYDYFQTFAKSIKFKDTVAPHALEVTSVTSGSAATSLTVTFSEPISSATFKVNGSVKAGVIAPDGLSATISGLSLDATKSHSLEVLNLTDYANNVTSHETKTFNVTKDVTVPNVGVSTLSDNQLLLTFDKKMDASTINTTNIKVKDELLNDLTLGGINPDPSDNTGKKFIVDLPAGLYTSKDSRNLTVLFNDSVTDSLGNKLPTQFKNVTISKDTTAPKVTNISFSKNPTTGNVDKVVVEFSEGLAANPAGYSTSGIKVIGPNGVDVTTGFFAANTATVTKGATKVEIPLSATVQSGKYTLYLPSGFVTDIAQTPNNSVASTHVVDFGTSPSGEFKITQSALGSTPSATTNVITVNYGTTVKGGATPGSATDLNNYTLNGMPLPEGTIITLNPALTTVTITIPDEAISKTDTAAVLRITNVQNSAGTVITPFVGTVSVTDSKAPVLSTAVLNTNGTFTVGFDEDLATPAVKGDFEVIINGKTVDASQITFTPGVGADAGKYVFGVNGLVKDPDGTPSNGDEFLYIDANNDGAYVAADDIKVTGANPTAGIVDLNSPAITSVKVATKASGTLTGADAAGNTLKLNISKTVK